MRLDRYYWREATDKVEYGRAKGEMRGEDVYKMGQQKNHGNIRAEQET